jgi:hypothetical protein
MRHEEQSTSCVYAKHYNKDYYSRNGNVIREQKKQRELHRKVIMLRVKEHIEGLSKVAIINDEVRSDFVEFIKVCCSAKH